MSHLFKNLIIAFGVSLVLGVVYFFTFGNSDEGAQDGGVMVTDLDNSEIALKTEKILSDIQKINTYHLDVSIFSDKRFVSLKDYRVKISDVTTGRENPFEPIN